jgi:hypothetical protein
MSDDLDQNLLRAFANASESLPGAAFEAKIAAGLQRSRGWRGLPHTLGVALGGIFFGVAAGITSPFRSRLARRGIFALLVSAVITGIAALSV